MDVQRLADGLWRWILPHPDWVEGDEWDQTVGCLYCETATTIVLIDPLLPPPGGERDRFWRALDRDVERLGLPVTVALTCCWHTRSTAEVRNRYDGVRVWGPADHGERLAGLVTDVAREGEELAPGITTYVSGAPDPENEVIYWLADHQALVVGDVLLAGPSAETVLLSPASWYDASDAEREWYGTELRPLLRRLGELDVQTLLLAHGPPVVDNARAALLQALN